MTAAYPGRSLRGHDDISDGRNAMFVFLLQTKAELSSSKKLKFEIDHVFGDPTPRSRPQVVLNITSFSVRALFATCFLESQDELRRQAELSMVIAVVDRMPASRIPQERWASANNSEKQSPRR